MNRSDAPLELIDAELRQQPHGARSSALFFWVLCIIPTIPMLLVHCTALLDVKYWFIPLAIGLTAFLVWKRADSPLRRPKNWVGYTIIGLAMLCVLLSALARDPWWSALGFILVVGAALRTLRGPVQRNLTSLVVPLLCILGPALNFDRLVETYLNHNAAFFSSIILDSLGIFGAEGVPHTISGSTIRLFETEIIGRTVNSGGVSFLLVFFIATGFLAWKRMSVWLTPLYLLAAFVTTLLIYTLQLTVSVFATNSLGYDLLESVWRFVMPVLAGILAFGMLFSFHNLIASLFHYVEPNIDTGENPLVTAWNHLTTMSEMRAEEDMRIYNSRRPISEDPDPVSRPIWIGLMGCAFVLVLASTVQAARGQLESRESSSDAEPFISAQSLDLSSLKLGLQLGEAVSEEVGESKNRKLVEITWEGEIEEAILQLRISQPLSGWMELSRGYERQGWELLDRSVSKSVLESDDTGDDDEISRNHAVTRLRKSDPSLEGYLYFSAVDSDGVVLAAPTGMASLGGRVMSQLGYGSKTDKPVAMIQLFAASTNKLSPSDVRRMESAFITLRDYLASQLEAPSSDEE